MNISLFITFFALSIVNVFLQTAKTLVMIKTDNKHIASVTQAIVFAFYTIVIVYTNCELSLALKCLVCGLANLIGSELSYTVINPIMARFKKDKLWRVEATIRNTLAEEAENLFHKNNLSYTFIPTSGERVVVFLYCKSQKESLWAKKSLDSLSAKYFVTQEEVRL